MIHLEPKYLQQVQTILKQIIPQYEVWAFGSRVHGKGLKKFSDLDLVIITDKTINPQLITQLTDSFAESDLPFRVDVLEWNDIDISFQKSIQNEHDIIQTNLSKKS